jgi:pyruvate formate lyase activating enzyme
MATSEGETVHEGKCPLLEQGFLPGSCAVWSQGRRSPACRATLKWENGKPYRLIKAAHLSRPEHYFSVYQSGCNWSCKKCHSWEFTQYAAGDWMSPDDIAVLARDYAAHVTYTEPRQRATAFHAHDLCRSCGTCIEPVILPAVGPGGVREKLKLVPTGRRSSLCPGKLDPQQMVLSPQGIGPARNIIAFTGGDLACQPEFYVSCAEKIKQLDLGLWLLFETNGYALTPRNLDLLRSAGVDAFWLDIKAHDDEVHRRLTGATNEWVLTLPGEMLQRGFVLEVLSLYIPGWVETDQIGKIASLLAAANEDMPFTILAFFPQHEMRDVPPPTLEQMVSAYEAARTAGLKHVRLGNLGVFARTEKDYNRLAALVPDGF